MILPDSPALSTVCEKMGKIDNKIIISANNCGQLRFRAESESASVQTDWQGLSHPEFEKGDSQEAAIPEDEKINFHSVTVEHRSLNKLLKSHTIASTTIVCM